MQWQDVNPSHCISIFLNLENSQTANFDGEFHLGFKTATSQSYAKAFALLASVLILFSPTSHPTFALKNYYYHEKHS